MNRAFIDDAPRMRNTFRPGRGILARKIIAKGKILPRPLKNADGSRVRKVG